jgi:hypothetical protein
MLRCLFVVACFLTLYSCQKDINDDEVTGAQYPVEIRFKGMSGSDSLEPGKTYVNLFNEEFQVSAFKFYIHSIELRNSSTNARSVLSEKYHLIDLTDPSSVVINGTASAKSYNRISFVIGVDSALNVSGAQTGALDPLKGMFWTWNSGYIMAKLEGNSPEANTANNAFEYHIGGFRTGQNVVKKIETAFPNNGELELTEEKNASIVISADVQSWFSGAHDIRISQNPVCMTPGTLAVQIAENYYNMFSVSSINQP